MDGWLSRDEPPVSLALDLTRSLSLFLSIEKLIDRRQTGESDQAKYGSPKPRPVAFLILGFLGVGAQFTLHYSSAANTTRHATTCIHPTHPSIHPLFLHSSVSLPSPQLARPPIPVPSYRTLRLDIVL